MTEIVADLNDEVKYKISKDEKFSILEHMLTPCHLEITHKSTTLCISNEFKC